MDRTTQARERAKLGATPDLAIGSVHAVTEDGHVLIASNTGSQLPAYVYAAGKVIWVVGAQKIIKNIPYAKMGKVVKDGKFTITDKTKIVKTDVKKLYKIYHRFSEKMK